MLNATNAAVRDALPWLYRNAQTYELKRSSIVLRDDMFQTTNSERTQLGQAVCDEQMGDGESATRGVLVCLVRNGVGVPA